MKKLCDKIKSKVKLTKFDLVTGILSAAIFLGGCSVGNASKKEGLYPLAGFNLGAESIKYKVKKLGKKIQTTPVHPDDSGFLTGQTTTNLEGDKERDFALKVGGDIGVGYNADSADVRFRFGGDIRYNPLSGSDFREGLYDTKQQVSDVRPPGSGSFVFTQLNPDAITLIPRIGIETTLFEKLDFGVEVGFPYMEWAIKSGHDRWGRWQTVQKDSWKGFGKRYAGKIGWRLENGLIFLSVFKESYKPDFAGEDAEIEDVGIFIGYEYRF